MARLVFCEDEPSIRRLIQAALRSTTHEVHLTADGAEGLELIERLRPDAIFTDLRMPRLDGLELCGEIKARPHLADIPIVVITASAQRQDLETVYACGVTSVMIKPFSPADLRAMVDRITSGEG